MQRNSIQIQEIHYIYSEKEKVEENKENLPIINETFNIPLLKKPEDPIPPHENRKT